MDQPTTKSATPYEVLGGSDMIERIVARFYDLMGNDPAYAELRAIHAEDLGPVQAGLTQFLNAWTGGPKDWFAHGKCVMSLHRAFPISAEIGDQWADAMARAIAEQRTIDPDLGEAMQIRLAQMARAMVNQQQDTAAG